MNQILLQQKTDRRKTALALLQKQLENGTKPISKGPKPGKKGDKMQYLPLIPAEKQRIQDQIKLLETKIANDEETIAIRTLMAKKMSLTPADITVVRGLTKKVRPKHPNTKLYKFIAGIYKRLTT